MISGMRPKLLRSRASTYAEELLFFALRELSAGAVIPDDACIEAMSDLTLNTVKGSSADEENLLGVDLNHLLIWMLTTTLRGGRSQ